MTTPRMTNDDRLFFAALAVYFDGYDEYLYQVFVRMCAGGWSGRHEKKKGKVKDEVQGVFSDKGKGA